MSEYSSWSDEDLEARALELADQRTQIRLDQNAVSAEIELRKTLLGMSGAAREALVLRLGGDVRSGGSAKGDKSR